MISFCLGLIVGEIIGLLTVALCMNNFNEEEQQEDNT